MEEASRIDENILHEVVAPMLKVQNTVLICLSTNLGKDNWYSKLFQNSDPKTAPLISKLEVSLLCDDCRKFGRKPSDCNHKDHLHPPWNVAGNKDRVKIFMNNEAMYAREVLGEIMSDETCVIQEAALIRFKDRPPIQLTLKQADVVYTFIDPNGGGLGVSDMGIISLVRLPNNQICIVGMTAYPSRDVAEIVDVVQNYFIAMKQHPIYGNSEHILFVENNFGGTPYADLFVKTAQQVIDIDEFRADPRVGAGVHTDDRNKNHAVMTVIFDMFHNRVHFASEMVCAHPKELPKHIDEFHGQLSRLRRVQKGGHMAYNAKNKKTGQSDDILICFVMCHYWSFLVTKERLIDDRNRNDMLALEQAMTERMSRKMSSWSSLHRRNLPRNYRAPVY